MNKLVVSEKKGSALRDGEQAETGVCRYMVLNLIRKGETRRIAIAALVSVLFAGILTVIYPTVSSVLFAPDPADTTVRMTLIRFVLFTVCMFLIGMCGAVGLKRVGVFLHAHRFVIGAGIVAFCVLLDLNGSSLNSWNYMLGWDYQQGVVYGTPRVVRGDEFSVATPLAFAQEYNDYGYFNALMGNRPSDMFIIKDAPVWALGEIFRPFHWGYLLLGSSRGLAFYWSARLVALFLAGYQFFLMLCANRRRLAVFGGVLVTFAPLTQWWFAVNSLPEMLIAIFLSIVMFHRYIDDRDSWHRLGYAAVIFECAGMFILTLYPAWQIPLAYVLLLLIIWTCAEKRRVLRFTKRDAVNLVVVLLAFAVCIGSVLRASYPTIQATLNTSYPGHRVSTGNGFPLWTTFNGLASLAYPFKEYIGLFNSSESAMMIDFFPLGFVLFVIAEIRFKRHDVLSWMLAIYSGVCLLYMNFGLPGIVAKLMLFSMTTSPRCYFAFALANILLLLRSMSRFNFHPTRRLLLFVSIGAVAYAVVAALCARRYSVDYVNIPLFVMMVVFVIIGVIAIITWRTVWGARAMALIIAALVFTGMSVNPIQYSSAAITDQPISNEVKAIQSNQPGVWLVDGSNGGTVSQLLAANGVTTLNTVYVTPNLELWRRIDPEGQWKNIYNRYAFVNFDIVAQKPDKPFTLIGLDRFSVKATPDMLMKLGVNYVLTSQDLSQMHVDGYRFEPIGEPIHTLAPYRLVKVE